MLVRSAAAALAFLGAVTAGRSTFHPQVTPEQEFVALIKSYATLGLPADWSALDRLRGVTWAPLPPTSLTNCAPDGGCFARQGLTRIAGRPIALVASGARTMVMHLYFRNSGAPFGEEAMLTALHAASITTALVRCPLRGSAGGTNWYRLGGTGVAPSVLAIQAASARRANEGYVVSSGADLPALQPNQLALYSEQCDAAALQAAVSTALPHGLIAQAIVALLVPSSRASYDWKTLATVSSGIAWDPAGPTRVDLSSRGDRNPMSMSGSVAYGGRQFSLLASGTAAQVTAIYLDENGLHPRGEHMLGVVYQKGVSVQLRRCGPVYTESTNNWYALTSAGTRPAMIRQSIRYDGTRVQDAYELRLDGTLPVRDPRDREPGVNGCR